MAYDRRRAGYTIERIVLITVGSEVEAVRGGVAFGITFGVIALSYYEIAGLGYEFATDDCVFEPCVASVVCTFSPFHTTYMAV